MSATKQTLARQEVKSASKTVGKREAAPKKTKLYRDYQAEIRLKKLTAAKVPKGKSAAYGKAPRRAKKRGLLQQKRSDDLMDRGKRLPGSGWAGKKQ